jgi:NADH-quinone oxidoreductase subunit F
MGHLLPARPVADLTAYAARGGGRGITAARRLGSDGVVATIREAGLRGRGGAGFPTGIKWAGIVRSDAETRYVVCNAAEGEPGTFKDRILLRRNPYQLLEGLAIAAATVGASAAFIGIKDKFGHERTRLDSAVAEVSAVGWFEECDLVVVPGPDDYLFGEEKGMLEVIEGRDPLPRLFPPYAQGLFEQQNGSVQPVVVNNVETLANVPHILAEGSGWFRTLGTDLSPGTIVCTIGGDVAVETVAELEMGTPLRTAIEELGGGSRSRPIRIITNGVSNAPLTTEHLDTPLSFEGMSAAGSGLGSAGFAAHDDGVCVVQLAASMSAFLYRGSCGQCPPCKLGTGAISEGLLKLAVGGGNVGDVEDVAAWVTGVTDANRCGLGYGQREVARGLLERFPEDVAHHAAGRPCPADRTVTVTTIEDWDEETGRFTYAAPVGEDAPGG